MNKFMLTFLSLSLLTACSNQELHYTGYAEADLVNIGPTLDGRLTLLSVNRGDWVDSNALLFTQENENEIYVREQALQEFKAAESQYLDLTKGKRPDELDALQAEREQAVAELKLSDIQLKRNAKLLASSAITKEQYDETFATYQSNQARVAQFDANIRLARLGARSDQIQAAEANQKATREVLNQAEWNLSQKRVVAPSKAFVFDTFYSVGEWITAGQPVVSLLPPENLKARFFVPETDLSKIQYGQSVNLKCDGCKKSISAIITFISPTAEYTPPVIFSYDSRDKLVYLIEARVNPEDAPYLHPGQPLDITLNLNQK